MIAFAALAFVAGVVLGTAAVAPSSPPELPAVGAQPIAIPRVSIDPVGYISPTPVRPPPSPEEAPHLYCNPTKPETCNRVSAEQLVFPPPLGPQVR